MGYAKAPNWIDVAALAAALIVLTLGLGQYGFYEPHEGHFAGVAREMVLRGDWVTPILNGAPYLNKPPLLYWMGAASLQLLGFSEFAARLPLSLSGWLGVIVAWKWSRDLWGGVAGRVAALMLSAAMGWFIFTHQLLIDALLSTLILAMLYCLWRLVWEPQQGRYFLALYGLLGLSILAKGFLGLIFFCLGCVGLILTQRSLKVLRKLKPLTGAGITLAIILPWFIAVERANPGFLQYLLVNEHLKRVVDTRWPPDYEVSSISPWGYLAVTALWCFPWIVLLPQTCVSAWKDYWQGQSSPSRQQRHSEGIVLLSTAIALPVLLFLPMSSRLVYYSVPAIAPFVILCSGWWSRCETREYRSGRYAAALLFSLLGIGCCAAIFWLPGTAMQNLPEIARVPGVGSILVKLLLPLGLGLVLGGILLGYRRSHLALVSLFLGLAIAWGSMTNGFAAVQDFRSAKTLIETANSRLGLATLWTFEGSRELGAAGAMSYYLDPDGQHYPSEIPGLTGGGALPPGWAPGKPGTAYRIVLVLANGGPNRIPPQFPGPTPNYLITQDQLQTYWNSSRPVVFVTDFLRQPDQPEDPLDLNLPKDAGQPLLEIGPRKLYGNAVATQLWSQQ